MLNSFAAASNTNLIKSDLMATTDKHSVKSPPPKKINLEKYKISSVLMYSDYLNTLHSY